VRPSSLQSAFRLSDGCFVESEMNFTERFFTQWLSLLMSIWRNNKNESENGNDE